MVTPTVVDDVCWMCKRSRRERERVWKDCLEDLDGE